MTALVLVVLAWALLAATMAFVVGHGIRLADTNRPTRSGGGDDTWPAMEQRQAIPAS